MLRSINVALSRSALASGVLQEIRKDIILRNYPPETKLTERVLCLKYGISKTPARQILQQLENEGFVTMLDNGCKKTVEFTENDLDCLYSLRNLLEITAVKMVFEKKLKSYSNMLESFIRLESLSKASREAYFEYDVDFHHSIIEMSGNKYILHAYENIAPILYTMFQISYGIYAEDFFEDDVETHNRLMRSIICESEETCLAEFEKHHASAARNAKAALRKAVAEKK